MKIALGTAQFGLDYGVSNIHGKTKKYEVDKILQCAYNKGINMIDTAALYGNSQSTIGSFANSDYDWKIVTKTPHFIGDSINGTHVKQLTESFSYSLLSLGKKNVYGLLLHSCDDLLKPEGRLLLQKMEELKADGMVEKIGVSLYNSEHIDAILDKHNIDLVQLPINIIDQQLLAAGWLKKLKDNNIEIHARSIFLQGLLLMKKELVPPYFLPIAKKMDEFYKLASELSLSQLELALGFVIGINEIDRVVVGVNTVTQLQEILQASKTYIDPMKLIDISINDPAYTNPSLWEV